jgi:glycosyltransferase involved in cell wall biosynthesis
VTQTQADFAEEYGVPMADPQAPTPALRYARRGEGRLLSAAGAVRRRVSGRRLAYVDSHFPWQQSGFRYGDALALHELHPSTVFFSMYETTDAFPAPVLPLADFPRLAPRLGVTDVYGVFLDFALGLLGVPRPEGQVASPIEGLDISSVLARERIRLHASLPPGGGLLHTEASMARVGQLVDRADQVLSWVPSAIARDPRIVPIDPAVIDTSFYPATAHDFGARPVHLLFVADAKARKGLDVAVAALKLLEADTDVHLHIVGPNEAWRDRAGPNATFYGWRGREALRELHARCPIFLSPVRAEDPGEDDGGIIDGFPTGAAAEAMSSGCLLITGNPEGDHRILTPDRDLLERPPSGEAFAGAVRSALADPARAAAIAASGAARVRERLDARHGVRQRVGLMGLGH